MGTSGQDKRSGSGYREEPDGEAPVNTAIPILRLLHIVPGAIWVGTAWCVALVLMPALRRLGAADGAKVGAAAAKPLSMLMHTAAGLNMLSGFVLMVLVPARPLVHVGYTFALVAFVCGMVGGASLKRYGAASVGEADAPLARSHKFLVATAVLVSLATALMAIAQNF